jgi:hypothetical protein
MILHSIGHRGNLLRRKPLLEISVGKQKASGGNMVDITPLNKAYVVVSSNDICHIHIQVIDASKT